MTSPAVINKHTTDPVTVQFVRKLAFMAEHPEWHFDYMHEAGEYVALRDNPEDGTVTVATGATMHELLNKLDEITRA